MGGHYEFSSVTLGGIINFSTSMGGHYKKMRCPKIPPTHPPSRLMMTDPLYCTKAEFLLKLFPTSF